MQKEEDPINSTYYPKLCQWPEAKYSGLRVSIILRQACFVQLTPERKLIPPKVKFLIPLEVGVLRNPMRKL